MDELRMAIVERHKKANSLGVGLAIGLVALAGCGGGHATPVSQPAARSTTTIKATGPPRCDEAAVQTASTCESFPEGHLVRVVHGHSELKLRTLVARIEGIRTASSFSGGAGTITAQWSKHWGNEGHAILLIISLHVTNTSSAPQVFNGEKQTVLVGGKEAYFTEKQSFITNNQPIQPGGSKTGDLVFDMPLSIGESVSNVGGNPHLVKGISVSDVRTRPESGLYVGNFGEVEEHYETEETEIGSGLITTKGA